MRRRPAPKQIEGQRAPDATAPMSTPDRRARQALIVVRSAGEAFSSCLMSRPTELLLVVVVALVVIGPKDLPKAMRFVGKWMGKARGMARHFRAGLDTMMREAELEELEKQWREQNDVHHA